MQIFERVMEVIHGQKPAALCIVIDSRGSTPRKAGSKMIVYSDGTVSGSVGGGSVEKDVIGKALTVIGTGIPAKFSFSLEEDLGMHCGGMMEIYIEPVNPVSKLIIFGAGHVGKALAGFARELDFAVTLIDPREKIFSEQDTERHKCLNKDYFRSIEEHPFDEHSYIVIVTPKHAFDEDILAAVAHRPHAYLGMIGSARKVELAKARFLEQKILTAEELAEIDMPIGIKFNAQTPQEIAISILAKMIDVRNGMKENGR